jgi:hypothetical protein
LSRLGTILDNKIDLAGVTDLSELDPERCGLAWNLRLKTAASEAEVRDVFAFVEKGAQIAIEREGASRVAQALAGRDSGPALIVDVPGIVNMASARGTVAG